MVAGPRPLAAAARRDRWRRHTAAGRGGRTRARQQPERGRAGSAWTADRSRRRIITTRDLALAFSPTERQATDPTSSPVVDLIADARLRVESALAGQTVTERAAGRLSAAAGCTEPTIRRSPAVTTTQSTRLPQPWQRRSPCSEGHRRAGAAERAVCRWAGVIAAVRRFGSELAGWLRLLGPLDLQRLVPAIAESRAPDRSLTMSWLPATRPVAQVAMSGARRR